MKSIKMIFLFLLCHTIVMAQPQHFSFIDNTGDTYSIIIDMALLHGDTLQPGDEIGVFTPSDLCVGASVWDGNTPLALIAWTDDSQTPEIDGYLVGEAMSYKIWDAGTDTEYEAEATFDTGNGNFGDGAYCLASLSVNEQIMNAIIVTNSNDSGQGSLRNAIDKANFDIGPETILFQIPTSDSNYNPETGVWTIKPQSPLPVITDDSLYINGNSQAQFAGDLNPVGPEIQLDGSEAVGSPSHGFFILSGMNKIEGLLINRFGDSGILLSGPGANDNLLIDNFIGVNSTADDVLPNGQYGVYIAEGARNSIGLLPDNANKQAIASLKKQKTRIIKENMQQAALGGGNLIAGNVGGGIYISGQMANENRILSNHVVSNFNHGITLNGSVSNTHIFLNTIAFNTGAGVMIDGENAIQNTMLTNAITANESDGIVLAGGNGMLSAPTILSVTDTSITGIAPANSLVQLFGDPDDEGEFVLGETSSDGIGQFCWSGVIMGDNVTATATDQNGNTSPFSEPFLFGGDLIVITTADDGPGSFRDALNQANTQPGPNRILFQIPATDDGYDSNTGVWTIRPVTSFPGIADEDLVIDGYSQTVYIGADTNSDGPEIELDGSLLTSSNGLYIFKSGAVIAGLIINRFDGKGISIFGINSGIISGCYIGTDAKGKQALGNGVGIFLDHNVTNMVIGSADSTLAGNLISGNKNYGIVIQDSCRHNNIIGNVIGPNSENTSIQESNVYGGIYVKDNCDSNQVLFNLIGSSQSSGVFIHKNSNCNLIEGNQIGTDVNWQLEVGNVEDGVIIYGSKNNQILENVIGLNGKVGVRIFGEESIGNSIRRNEIFQNGEKGIELSDGGNAGLLPPAISSVISTQVSGTAQADQVIDIFADENDQGQIYLGSATADGSGNFFYDHQAALPLPYITATATDAFGNTSEFSTPVVTGVETITSEQLPEKFVLHQNYPNPFNASTIIGFELPEDSFVELNIFNIQGREIVTLIKEKKNVGLHYVKFNAENLGSGVYLYQIKANDFSQIKKMILIR